MTCVSTRRRPHAPHFFRPTFRLQVHMAEKKLQQYPAIQQQTSSLVTQLCKFKYVYSRTGTSVPGRWRLSLSLRSRRDGIRVAQLQLGSAAVAQRATCVRHSTHPPSRVFCARLSWTYLVCNFSRYIEAERSLFVV